MPTNWHQAEEIEFWGKVCPTWEYEWLEATLNCETKIIEIRCVHPRITRDYGSGLGSPLTQICMDFSEQLC